MEVDYRKARVTGSTDRGREWMSLPPGLTSSIGTRPRPRTQPSSGFEARFLVTTTLSRLDDTGRRRLVGSRPTPGLRDRTHTPTEGPTGRGPGVEVGRGPETVVTYMWGLLAVGRSQGRRFRLEGSDSQGTWREVGFLCTDFGSVGGGNGEWTKYGRLGRL